jgi:hypothetical protein
VKIWAPLRDLKFKTLKNFVISLVLFRNKNEKSNLSLEILKYAEK